MKTIEDLILSGQFESAGELLKNYDIQKTGRLLLDLSCKAYSICPYGYLIHQLLHNETAYWHAIATEIFLVPLCHLEGADAVGLYHIRRAIALEPDNITWKQLLLAYYRSPEPIVSKEEAILISKEILALDPDNLNALELLAKYAKQ